MAGTILTPTALWKDFVIEEDLTIEVIEEEKKDDLLITRLYLNGRTVKDGRVKIYGVLARNAGVISAPAILAVQDVENGADATLVERLAKEGYIAFTVDLAGEYRNREYHTVYPESLSYANYNAEKFHEKKIDGDVADTWWYEWGCALKYAYAFLKNQCFVSKTGVIGINGAATPLWYVVATEKDVACAVFVSNAGWRGYEGIYKFENVAEPQFDDAEFKYLAAADPQAYARHVACPTYILSPTNSAEFDLDRACDTLSRIDEKYYSAADYCAGAREAVDYACYKSALVFLSKYLNGVNVELPSAVSIKAEIADNKISVEATPDLNGLKTLSLYASEGESKPSVRCWQKVASAEKEEKFVFEYRPYHDSQMVCFYAKATYSSGFSRCSPVIYKKFSKEEVSVSQKDRIIFTSRIKYGETAFSPSRENLLPPVGIELVKTEGAELKKGSMDMSGLSCPRGVLTFKINAEKFRPSDGMMLMFDVCGKTPKEFTVKLIADYFGKKTEYAAKVAMVGGDVWQNVKIEQNKFKTFEGMILKSYEKIQAIEFVTDGECMINNALWV